ncbi:MAG: dockerin type I domain-containing protein, partial [Planctomycetota bacterium]
MHRFPVSAATIVIIAGAATASAQVEPILFSDGIIPGVFDPGGTAATVWQTGLYRIANSPDRSLWAIRVNNTSSSDNEYIVSGSGLVGNTVVHSSATEDTVPATSQPIFYISERELSINDSGDLAVGGSDANRATTDTAYFVDTGTSVTVIAQENNFSFTRPAPTLLPYPVSPSIPNPLTFNALGVGDISNTGKIAILDTDIDQVLLWDSGTLTLLAEDDDPVANQDRPGEVLTGLISPGANGFRSTIFYFENQGEDPIVAFQGRSAIPNDGNQNGLTDELSTDTAGLITRDPSSGTLESQLYVGDVVDSRVIGSSLNAWVDADGNTFATGTSGSFFPPSDGFGIINGEVVADVGLPVGGTVAGEQWFGAASNSNGPWIFALDRRPDGAYIIGGVTNNPGIVDGGNLEGNDQPDINVNRVVMFVAPDGTRTELLRTGQDFDVTLPDGTVQTRKLAVFNQSDATFSMYIDDTHLYFLAGTTPYAGTIPSDLFARVELPNVGGDRLCGDVNNDGTISDSDFFAWVTAFIADPRTPEQLTACDVNDDGNC